MLSRLTYSTKITLKYFIEMSLVTIILNTSKILLLFISFQCSGKMNIYFYWTKTIYFTGIQLFAINLTWHMMHKAGMRICETAEARQKKQNQIQASTESAPARQAHITEARWFWRKRVLYPIHHANSNAFRNASREKSWRRKPKGNESHIW